MCKLKIAVIDSGISLDGKNQSENIAGCEIIETCDSTYQIANDFIDKIGHGTAVVDELTKIPNLFDQIFCIKIFKDTLETSTEMLIYALNYVYKNLECKILLISSGITYCDNYN